MKELDQMLTTIDIAEMMGMRHDRILRKLEGQDVNGKHIEGIIEVINGLKIGDVNDTYLGADNYFIKSSYIDAKGEKRPCYNVTRKGCEFLAHKFNGKKGIEFTARYIERFHQMEEMIKTGITPAGPLPEPQMQRPVPALPEIPKFRGNHIDHKETAALFIKQYIAENGGSFGVYRAYRNNQMDHGDVILPYNMFRRVRIRTEKLIVTQAMA